MGFSDCKTHRFYYTILGLIEIRGKEMEAIIQGFKDFGVGGFRILGVLGFRSLDIEGLKV